MAFSLHTQHSQNFHRNIFILEQFKEENVALSLKKNKTKTKFSLVINSLPHGKRICYKSLDWLNSLAWNVSTQINDFEKIMSILSIITNVVHTNWRKTGPHRKAWTVKEPSMVLTPEYLLNILASLVFFNIPMSFLNITKVVLYAFSPLNITTITFSS